MELRMDLSSDTNLLPYFIAFIVCVVIIGYIYERKRSEALQIVAKKLGFSFSKSGRGHTEQKHQGFQLFSKGHGGTIKNEIWGRCNDINVSIFGYQYTVGYGKHSRTYNQTVKSMDCSRVMFPTFELIPENTFHKIGQVFGYQDIDFESFPEFSKKYLLRGEDELKIRQLFTPQIISFFESNKNLCVEAENNTLIFYKASKRCKPDDIQEYFEKGQLIHNLFVR